jgi:uncharacterized membrane protein SpoIIM required for sporulation
VFSVANIITGLIIIALGVASLRFNYQLVGMTGRQDWIENFLGGGSTYFVYKLFSIVLILAGLLYGTGLATPFFSWLLSPLRNIFPHA